MRFLKERGKRKFNCCNALRRKKQNCRQHNKKFGKKGKNILQLN